MTARDVERSDEQGHGPVPWWADLGAWGAVALMVFGALAAVWVWFRLPGTPEELATEYYGAAKVVAIGLVLGGSALLNRRRSRATDGGETTGAERV